MDASLVAELLDQSRGRRVAVIGDAVVDRYVYGEPERISREAPILILRWGGEETRPGGAANAAANAAALSATVRLVSLVGDDAAADDLQSLVERRGITAQLIRDPLRATTVKTRFMAGNRQTVRQQVLRLDRGETAFPGVAVERELVAAALRACQDAEAVVLSEYGAGSLSAAVIDAVMEHGRRSGVPVVVDSRYRMPAFKGAYAATPNTSEAEHLVGQRLRTEDDYLSAGRRLLEELHLRLLVITRGDEGMSVFTEGGAFRLRAYQVREVFDVSGAGDTVVSAIAIGLACGPQHVLTAALLADVAAGIVVGKPGVAVAEPDEIRRAVRGWTPQIERYPGS